MKKHFVKLSFVITLLLSTMAFAQTAEELKAEREEFKKELKSEKRNERLKKIDKLEEPKKSGVSSVDDLAVDSFVLLVATKSLNNQIPELYKRTIGESVDGVTDVTVKKPTLDELLDVAKNITTQISLVEKNMGIIDDVSGDVKKANPLSAGKALKSLNFSKDILSVTLPELQTNLKVVKNLISTLSTSNNL